MWIAGQGWVDSELHIKSDNTGVIDVCRKGVSRSAERNASIRSITSILLPYNLTLHPLYVLSGCNLADPISHDNLGPAESRLEFNSPLPEELQQLIEYV
jgi:hypothetical protein